jgi:hypothetical protein
VSTYGGTISITLTWFPGHGIQLLAERDAEAVDGGLGGAVDGVEADGDVAEAGWGEEDGGFLSARRCGRTRRVRINGAVRLVVISVAVAVPLEVAGSAKEMKFMMPALMKTVSMVGKEVVILEILAGRVLRSVTSSWMVY